jgi:molybdate transport system regulatory protein
MTRLFFRVEFSTEDRLGPGKIRLLEQIQSQGSISAAARAMGMSYRRAWLLTDSLNKMFDEPVITAQTGGAGGGAATLTPFGVELIRVYRTMEKDVTDASRASITALERHRPIGASPPNKATKRRSKA